MSSQRIFTGEHYEADSPSRTERPDDDDDSRASVTSKGERGRDMEEERKEGRNRRAGRKTRCVAASVSGLAFCDPLSTLVSPARIPIGTWKARARSPSATSMSYLEQYSNFHVALEKNEWNIRKKEKAWVLFISIISCYNGLSKDLSFRCIILR